MSSTGKKCLQCKEHKPIHHYEYHFYFKRLSNYCVVCENRYKAIQKKVRQKEAAERKKIRDKEKSKSLEIHGLTPAALSTLEIQATTEARKIANKKLDEEFGEKRRKGLISFLNRTYGLLLLWTFISFLFVTTYPINTVVSIFLVIIYVNAFEVIEKPIKKREQELVIKHKAPIFKIKKTKLAEQRKFYSSSSWTSLRTEYINKVLKKTKQLTCNYCETTVSKKEVTVDHIKPRSRFPELALDISNLAISCRSCNSSKGAKDLEEFVS